MERFRGCVSLPAPAIDDPMASWIEWKPFYRKPEAIISGLTYSDCKKLKEGPEGRFSFGWTKTPIVVAATLIFLVLSSVAMVVKGALSFDLENLETAIAALLLFSSTLIAVGVGFRKPSLILDSQDRKVVQGKTSLPFDELYVVQLILARNPDKSGSIFKISRFDRKKYKECFLWFELNLVTRNGSRIHGATYATRESALRDAEKVLAITGNAVQLWDATFKGAQAEENVTL